MHLIGLDDRHHAFWCKFRDRDDRRSTDKRIESGEASEYVTNGQWKKKSLLLLQRTKEWRAQLLKVDDNRSRAFLK